MFLKMEGFPPFSWLVNIPLSMCVWLFNHSSFDGHLGCFYKEPSCQCRRHKRQGLDPWVRKIPRRRAQQPTPVFLLENPMDKASSRLQSTGSHRVGHDWRDSAHTHIPWLMGIMLQWTWEWDISLIPGFHFLWMNTHKWNDWITL